MTTERLEKLRAKQAQLAAKIRQEESRKRSHERKEDTRRKILAGAAVLDEAEKRPEFNAALIKLLGRFLSRPEDRAMFGLVPAEVTDGTQAAEISGTMSASPLGSSDITGVGQAASS